MRQKLTSIIASSKTVEQYIGYLVFRHRFNGTSGTTPSLTDETGKALTVTSGTPELRSATPSPAEGSAYLGGNDPGGVVSILKTTSPSDDFYIGGLGNVKFHLYGDPFTTNKDLIRLGDSSNGLLVRIISGRILEIAWRYNGSIITTFETSALNNSQWYEIDIVFQSGYIDVKIDGSSDVQDTFTRDKGSGDFYLEIHTKNNIGDPAYNLIDNLRIYKGIIV